MSHEYGRQQIPQEQPTLSLVVPEAGDAMTPGDGQLQQPDVFASALDTAADARYPVSPLRQRLAAIGTVGTLGLVGYGFLAYEGTAAAENSGRAVTTSGRFTDVCVPPTESVTVTPSASDSPSETSTATVTPTPTPTVTPTPSVDAHNDCMKIYENTTDVIFNVLGNDSSPSTTYGTDLYICDFESTSDLAKVDVPVNSSSTNRGYLNISVHPDTSESKSFDVDYTICSTENDTTDSATARVEIMALNPAVIRKIKQKTPFSPRKFKIKNPNDDVMFVRYTGGGTTLQPNDAKTIRVVHRKVRVSGAVNQDQQAYAGGKTFTFKRKPKHRH